MGFPLKNGLGIRLFGTTSRAGSGGFQLRDCTRAGSCGFVKPLNGFGRGRESASYAARLTLYAFQAGGGECERSTRVRSKSGMASRLSNSGRRWPPFRVVSGRPRGPVGVGFAAGGGLGDLASATRAGFGGAGRLEGAGTVGGWARGAEERIVVGSLTVGMATGEFDSRDRVSLASGTGSFGSAIAPLIRDMVSSRVEIGGTFLNAPLMASGPATPLRAEAAPAVELSGAIELLNEMRESTTVHANEREDKYVHWRCCNGSEEGSMLIGERSSGRRGDVGWDGRRK